MFRGMAVYRQDVSRCVRAPGPDCIRDLHPYETPEIVCIAMDDVNPDYLQWMEENIDT